MNLDELAARLQLAADNPPRPPRIVLRRGRRTLQTSLTEQRAIKAARDQVEAEARRRITG
jgi:hypothetical protein